MHIYNISDEMRMWESYLDVTVQNLRGILSYEMNGKSWGD